MDDRVHLYISGDSGSRDLRARLTDRGVPFAVHDIRKSDAKGDRVDLKYLAVRNLTTVPQLFTGSGEHIGNYEDALAWLDSLSVTERAELLPEPA